ncbi:MAG: hypothetical protein O7J95_17585, partial [Planctomycetota bacterium]|nr:hypothetical protein [Planctomycetota bacterium]
HPAPGWAAPGAGAVRGAGRGGGGGGGAVQLGEIAADVDRWVEALSADDREGGEEEDGSHPADGVLRRTLGRDRRILDAAETAYLSRTSGTAMEAAWLALEAASERLLVERIEREARRLVRHTVADWQMCSSLVGNLRDVRLELAAELLGQTTEEARGTLERKFRELARARLPDAHPGRLEVGKILDRSRRQPLVSSELFVVVESLRRAIS